MINPEDFKKHVLECYPQEACGVLIEDYFYPLKNIHPEPVNCFQLSQEDNLFLSDKQYKFLHSHTMEASKEDPRTPSLEDMRSQVTTGMPWGIVHCDGKDVSEILWFEDMENLAPILDRQYIFNVHDCFTLARDYYYNEFQKDTINFPRPIDWEKWNPRLIVDNYKNEGFRDVLEDEELQVHDLLLFRLASNNINHFGIYIGEDKFIHHLYQRKSCVDSLKKWDRQFAKAIRYIGK